MRIELGDITDCCYLGECREKRKYDKKGNRTEEQARNENGLPIWLVKTDIPFGKGEFEEVFVEVPLERDPAEGLQKHETIGFKNLCVVSGKRKFDKGRWEIFQADGIRRLRRAGGSK